jgi:hypothetical protein
MATNLAESLQTTSRVPLAAAGLALRWRPAPLVVLLDYAHPTATTSSNGIQHAKFSAFPRSGKSGIAPAQLN